MPEGHTLHRLARAQRAQFAGHGRARLQPAGPLRRRRARRRPRARRRDAPTASTCSPPSATASSTSTSACSARSPPAHGDPPPPVGAVRMRWVAETGWTDLRGPTACEVLSPSEVDAIQCSARPRSAGHPTRRRAGLRPHRPQPGPDRRLADGPGRRRRRRQRVPGRDPLPPPRRPVPARPPARRGPVAPAVGRSRHADAGRPAVGRIVTTERADRHRRTGRARREDAHYVYRRTGLPCRICATPVQMQPLSARKLYWCPVCQAG